MRFCGTKNLAGMPRECAAGSRRAAPARPLELDPPPSSRQGDCYRAYSKYQPVLARPS